MTYVDRTEVAVAIETLGCKLNQAESEAMALSLSQKGYSLVPPSDRFDIYILNTCTVTHVADRKSRHLLRLARRRNPQALTVAVGCYADRSPEDLEQMCEVDLTLRNRDKGRLPEMIEAKLPPIASKMDDGEALRTRSMVKIQEGCDHFCAYCIVPYVRGRERSLAAEEVISDIQARVDAGYREAVLTGTRLGAYTPGLSRLIHRILSGTGIERLRLSSLQPCDIENDLLALWSDDRLCRHIHLPLQSGSDAVLRRMDRPYSIAEYRRALERIREAIPGVSVTTDIIVGFPGESDGEFAESYDLCRRLGFSGIHVFSYSKRPGTKAESMPNHIDERVKKERSERMLRLAAESARSFTLDFQGKTMAVLWEENIGGGQWDGLTDNYIRVTAFSRDRLKNRVINAKLSNNYDKKRKSLEADLVL